MKEEITHKSIIKWKTAFKKHSTQLIRIFGEEKFKDKNKAYFNELNYIELNLLGWYETVKCSPSKKTFNLKNLPLEIIFNEDRCYENSLLVSSIFGGEIIFGLVETILHTIAFHSWNFIISKYYDFTFEFTKDDILGNKYFILKKYKPYNFFSIAKQSNNNKFKFFNNLLFNNIKINKKMAQIEYYNYYKRGIKIGGI